MVTYIYIHCILYVLFFPFSFSCYVAHGICKLKQFDWIQSGSHTTIDGTIVHDHTKSRFTIQNESSVSLSCSQCLFFGNRYLWFLVTCAVDCCACNDGSKLWIRKKNKPTNRETNESPMIKPQRTIQIIVVYRTKRTKSLQSTHAVMQKETTNNTHR